VAADPTAALAGSGNTDECRLTSESNPARTWAQGVEMNGDEHTIRHIIERWAVAAHTGDLMTVTAHHDPGIVMYDVPPPENGVRGLDAYRETWPGFFDWQRRASFDLLCLDVVAGEDVAFAYGLLRCGTPEELRDVPERRLRLTMGLRKIAGQWTILHEHHSFTARD
jgi:ketosteroid isomerase-like protein